MDSKSWPSSYWRSSRIIFHVTIVPVRVYHQLWMYWHWLGSSWSRSQMLASWLAVFVRWAWQQVDHVAGSWPLRPQKKRQLRRWTTHIHGTCSWGSVVLAKWFCFCYNRRFAVHRHNETSTTSNLFIIAGVWITVTVNEKIIAMVLLATVKPTAFLKLSVALTKIFFLECYTHKK